MQARYDFLLAAVDNLPNPIFMKDEDARFFFFNKAYSEFFNMKRSEYIGKTGPLANNSKSEEIPD